MKFLTNPKALINLRIRIIIPSSVSSKKTPPLLVVVSLSISGVGFITLIVKATSISFTPSNTFKVNSALTSEADGVPFKILSLLL